MRQEYLQKLDNLLNLSAVLTAPSHFNLQSESTKTGSLGSRTWEEVLLPKGRAEQWVNLAQGAESASPAETIELLLDKLGKTRSNAIPLAGSRHAHALLPKPLPPPISAA